MPTIGLHFGHPTERLPLHVHWTSNRCSGMSQGYLKRISVGCVIDTRGWLERPVASEPNIAHLELRLQQSSLLSWETNYVKIFRYLVLHIRPFLYLALLSPLP